MLKPILTADFTHVHPWIPMIHQGRVLERLADETQPDQLLIIPHAIVLAASKSESGADLYILESTRKWTIGSAMEISWLAIHKL